MTHHDEGHEGGKPPAPFDEAAGDQGLGSESGALEGGDEQVLESMPERRGEVRYPDVENPEGPPRTPREGEVVSDADKETDASAGADDDE